MSWENWLTGGEEGQSTVQMARRFPGRLTDSLEVFFLQRRE